MECNLQMSGALFFKKNFCTVDERRHYLTKPTDITSPHCLFCIPLHRQGIKRQLGHSFDQTVFAFLFFLFNLLVWANIPPHWWTRLLYNPCENNTHSKKGSIILSDVIFILRDRWLILFQWTNCPMSIKIKPKVSINSEYAHQCQYLAVNNRTLIIGRILENSMENFKWRVWKN